jgi:vitamin B12 transporter
MRRVLPLLLLFSSAVFSQQLKIHVTDPESLPVQGARVSVSSNDRVVAIGTTGASGDFTTNVPRGTFSIEVLAPNFAPQTVESAASEQVLNIQLRVAAKSETVQVTSDRAPIDAAESGTVPTTLDALQLENMQPTAFAEAVRFLPGAVVNNQGRRGGLAALFVRGGESRYTKVIVDGVTLNDVGGTFDFGVLPVQEFDRIEFVRGAESALYGTDAMTGTLQTFSRTGSTRVPELRFGADGGTFSTAHGYASLAGAYRRFDYNVFGNQFNTEGQGLNDEYSNASQGGNFGLAISNNVAARLRLRHSNSRSGVQSFWDYAGNPPLPIELDQYARQNNFLASLDITATLGRWQHTFSGQEYNHKRLNRDTGTNRGCSFPIFDCGFDDLFNMNRGAFEYRGEFTPLNWLRTVFGYRFEDENGFVNQDFSGFIINSHGLRRNHELYDELIFTRGRVSLIAGARFVHNESFGNKGVPRVAASYQVFKGNDLLSGTRLRFAYGKGFKEPRLEESFGAVGAFGLVTLPNPDLQPEENRSIEAGITQGFGRRASLSATYFNNEFTRLIIFNTDPVTFESQYINLGKSLAHGAELEFHSRFTERLSLDTSYTYTSTQVLESTASNPIFAVGAPLLRRPKHSGQMLLNYSARKWGGSLAGTFIGRRPDSDFFVAAVPVTSVAGYARFDLGGWYSINRHMTAYANVENLLNKKYQEVAGYPAPKANFRAGMRFRFGGE